MRNRFIKLGCVLFALMFSLLLLTACGEKQAKNIPQTEDKYRTYYQIFPYSFADSNGDGIGDINGIIDKLDYIDDMHFDGIWLTPVHQSPTYHKYDVVDYKSIDRQFGTMEDYDRLVEECHKRGMTILLDLVLNHTSDQNEWFKNFVSARLNNAQRIKYYNYFNCADRQLDGTWYSMGNNLYYEGAFWSGMPDLNWRMILEDPDCDLAQDIEDVMRFWLIDHDVDGFRLDATGEFLASDSDNAECLRWINDTAKSIKSDCYIVAEPNWGGPFDVYYSSGIDGAFLFNHSQGGGSISGAARMEKVSWFTDIDSNDKTIVGDGIPALFVANHDTGRAIGALQGLRDQSTLKFGYGLMSMCCGTTFWYYGDEVGMQDFPQTTGEKKVIDEHKRQPMPWGDEYQCDPVSGTDPNVPDETKYPLGDVKSNLKDKNSVINYITRANALRRSFPAIARNYGETLYTSSSRHVALIRKGTGEDAVYIVVNVSQMTSETLDLSEYGSFELAGTLSVNIKSTPKTNKSVLTLPPMTIAVLRKV